MARGTESGHTTPVRVPIGDQSLNGDLGIPAKSHGMVLFAHGSGSSRHSSRNQFVARALERRDLATLLIDLLTPEEESIDDHTAQYRFDIPMLADRLVTIVDWLRGRKETAALPIGLFGASTGGGAALMAAADRPREIAAVVSAGTSGSRRSVTGKGHDADAADRGRARHTGDSDEPRCDEADARRGHPGDRARRDALVRGARDARTCGGACGRLVRPPSAACLSARRG